MTLIIGVDPGSSGAVAWYHKGEHHAVPFKGLEDTELLEILEGLGSHVFAYLEAVHSFPRDGNASAFKFGVHFGKLKMALTSAGISYETVAPSKWQRKMGCLSGGDKKVTREKAIELFPLVNIHGRGAKPPTHAVADALLIAEYGRLTYGE